MAQTQNQAQARTVQAVRIDLWAVLEAGLIAGIVFLGLEFITGSLGGRTALGPATVTLRMVLNVGTAPSSGSLVTAAMFMHFSLSLLTTFLLGLIIHHWARYHAVGFGFVYGACLYMGNVVLFIVIQPELEILSDVLMLIDYVLYGAAAAWFYKRRQALTVVSESEADAT